MQATCNVKLKELFQQNRTIFSYELFPPKTEKGEQALFRHVETLCQYKPDFITCTYGAGGSTRGKTLEIIGRIKEQYGIPVASHLTLVGSTVDQLRDYLRQAKEQKTDYIVALRGDPPQGESEFHQVPGGLRYANELVELIRDEFPNDFSVAVAGYPEKHQEAPSMAVDLENLKRKVDAGADVIVTQLFYDNADFFRFRDECEKMGIQVPVVPGILPVTNLGQIQRITSLCGSKLPKSFVDNLSRNEDPDHQFQVGVEFATQQIAELLNNSVPGIHFYVLNKSQATIETLRNVSLISED